MKRLRRVIIFLAVVALLVWWLLPAGGPHVQPGSVLALRLSGSYVESSAPSFFSRVLGEARQPFISVLGELAKAERDPRIRGVALRVRRLEIGWAMAQELRGAIELHDGDDSSIQHERAMLRSVLDLGEVQVGEIMVHRTNVTAIDSTAVVEVAIAWPIPLA